MNREELQPMTPFPEREANRQAYGPVFGEILNELLALVLIQGREGRLDGEVQVFAKAIFEDYVARYLPNIAAQAATYWEAQRTERDGLERQSSANETRRQERLKTEVEARERAAAEAEAARYSKARADEAAQLAELVTIRAREYREVQERMS
jgi:hypothetical protein